MKRALLLFVLALTGCGGVVFQADTVPGNTVTVTGFVTTVQLTAISGVNGTLVNVTIVTLQQSGFPQTFTFCGSQPDQFPLGQNLRVSFLPAATCGNIVVVVQI